MVVPVRLTVPVVKVLYSVPASRFEVMVVQPMPFILRCHWMVGVGKDEETEVKLALSPEQTVEFEGCTDTEIASPVSPIAKSLKDDSAVA